MIDERILFELKVNEMLLEWEKSLIKCRKNDIITPSIKSMMKREIWNRLALSRTPAEKWIYNTRVHWRRTSLPTVNFDSGDW